MASLTFEEKMQALKLVINSFNALASTAIFYNAIYRNINSGENTVAYRYDPNTPDFAGTDRFNGYRKPPPAPPPASGPTATLRTALSSLTTKTKPITGPARNPVKSSFRQRPER